MNLKPHTLVKLNTRGLDIKLRELTFSEYKNFCKSLFSHNSVDELSVLFDELVADYTDIQFDANILEKVIILLYIRELTIGKQITLSTKEYNMNMTTDVILDKINKKISTSTIKSNGIEYSIGLPTGFLFGDKNLVSFVVNSILSLKIDDKFIDISNLPADKKEEIISYLPALPIVEIYNSIIRSYSEFSFNIKIDKSYSIQLFDGSFIHFLKNIFDERYQNVLNFEYELRKYLNFTAYDFEKTAYPECKIMLDKLHQEAKEQDKNKDS